MNRIAMTALAAVTICGAAQAAEMTIYKQPHFKGDKVTVREESRDLRSQRITDQASSVVVHDGRWQVCTQPDFNGECRILGPGKYATLDAALNHRIESVRELDRTADRRDDGDKRWDHDRDRGWDNGDRRGWDNDRKGRWEHGRGYAMGGIELFPEREFRGPSVRVEHDLDNLRGTDLNNGASSAVVHDGTWELCTRPGFSGRCKVLVPGEYPRLAQLDDRVSSLRRVR
ncbi:MAG TPA: beta/gamma crystallin-related protein [Usitatibacter sp.]